MHGCAPGDGVRSNLRQSDVLDISGLHHVGEGADRSPRSAPNGVEPRGAVDVDGFNAEPLQRVGEKIFHGGGAAVQPRNHSGIAQRAELDADLEIVAIAAGERFADQHLIVAHAVEIAGVEQGDAGIERGVDGGDALAAVGRAVKIRHAHAAEADR